MRILFVSNGFPPQRWAGTETYTAGIAKGLRGRGHAVHVLCGGHWVEGRKYWHGYEDDGQDGLQVRRLCLNWKKAPDPFGYLYDNPVVGKYLETYLEQVRPDLVHVTSCETLSASVLRTAKKCGLPLVLSLTDLWFLCPRITLLHGDGSICDGQTTAWECLRCKLLDSKAFRWPDHILPDQVVSLLLMTISRYPILARQRGLRGMAGDMATRKAFLRKALNWPDIRTTASAFIRDIHLANGISAPIKIQPYGHDLSWLRAYSGKVSSNRIRIGFIGQITPPKGVHLLLQASHTLQSDFGDQFSVSIYGDMQTDNRYSAELCGLAADASNVQFCGTYPHERSAAVFAGIDVLVVPSTWYDFPLIVHEAFATKTPVIATRLGTMAEHITHDVNGLLFERGDVDDLAGQLRRILAEPGLLERLRVGIPPVKTIDQEVTELEATYDDLVARETHRDPVFGAEGGVSS